MKRLKEWIFVAGVVAVLGAFASGLALQSIPVQLLAIGVLIGLYVIISRQESK